MTRGHEFDELLAEASAASVDGWSFSWLDGRATEARPSWRFAQLLTRRAAEAEALLDIQTGGGEVFAEVLHGASPRPGVVAATDSWPPNIAIARTNLQDFDAVVADCANDADLPFDGESFDLVTSRHPVLIRWDEVARVLRSRGSYLGQHVGPGTNRELTDFFMGPQPVGTERTAGRAVEDAEAQGLTLVDLREESLRVEFYDVGAVVFFLRKVIWTVPGFSVERYHDRLRQLHDKIATDGVFVSHATRYLIELTKPPR